MAQNWPSALICVNLRRSLCFSLCLCGESALFFPRPRQPICPMRFVAPCRFRLLSAQHPPHAADDASQRKLAAFVGQENFSSFAAAVVPALKDGEMLIEFDSGSRLCFGDLCQALTDARLHGAWSRFFYYTTVRRYFCL